MTSAIADDSSVRHKATRRVRKRIHYLGPCSLRAAGSSDARKTPRRVVRQSRWSPGLVCSSQDSGIFARSAYVAFEESWYKVTV
jgi:hypothetical protein